MKVWITKYALTEGIKSIDAKLHQGDNCVSDQSLGGGAYIQYYHGEGKEWHRTLEGARQRAEHMRMVKIAALKKQLDKLERMIF